MRLMSYTYGKFWLVVLCLATISPAVDAIEEIEDASREVEEALRRTGSPNSVDTRRLEEAVKKGQEVIEDLKSEVKSLDGERTKLNADLEILRDERAKLVQIQTALTSGLIGAIVTALIAFMGLIVNFRGSRAERDLKRLSAIEKATQMHSSGVSLPQDILDSYVGSKTSS